jgi:hypothetical protein
MEINIYREVDSILEKLGFKKYFDLGNRIRYSGIFFSGDLSPFVYDYDRGFLFVSMSSSIITEGSDINDDKWNVYVYVHSYDDSEVRFFDPNLKTQKECEQIIEKIKQDWECEFKLFLPESDTLIEFLDNYGLSDID